MSEMTPEPEPVTVVTAGVAEAQGGAPDTGAAVGVQSGTAGAQGGAPGAGDKNETVPEPVPGWDVQFQAAQNAAAGEDGEG